MLVAPETFLNKHSEQRRVDAGVIQYVRSPNGSRLSDLKCEISLLPVNLLPLVMPYTA